jgi:hypothetical protein
MQNKPFKANETLPDLPKVKGYDFNKGTNFDDIFDSFKTTGI